MNKKLKLTLMLTLLLLWSGAVMAQKPVFTERFNTTKGEGGVEGNWSKPTRTTKEITPDNQDVWKFKTCSSANECIKVGKGKEIGTATASISNVTKANKLTFKAAAFGKQTDSKVIVTVKSSEKTIFTKTEELEKEKYIDFTLPFNTEVTGELTIVFSSVKGKMFFLDDVIVYAEEGTQPDPNPNPHPDGEEVAVPTIEGIAKLKEQTDNTKVRLLIKPEENARVILAENDIVYLQDDNHAVAISKVVAEKFTTNFAHNQHVAGWIRGMKTTINGVTTLQATTETNADSLLIANPVTEIKTEPKNCTAAEAKKHIGEWVNIQLVSVKGENGNYTLNADDNTELTLSEATKEVVKNMIYDGALVDLAGVITLENNEKLLLHAVTADDYKPLTYVVSENKPYKSVPSTKNNVNIRLDREFISGEWTTLCLPFNATINNASIREFDHMDGNTMCFKKANEIKAGVPYVVKMNEDKVNIAAKNITLEPKGDLTAGDATHKIVGTYGMNPMSTDGNQFTMDKNGNLLKANTENRATIKTTHAYFMAKAGTTIEKLLLEGTPAGIVETPHQPIATTLRVYTIDGKYLGNSTNNLPKGIYIVNGKKYIIK